MFQNAHLELASEARRSEIIEFLKQHFYPDETLCKSIEINFDEELYQTWWKKLQDDLSVLLISDKSNEIIGVRIIGLAERGNRFDSSQYKNEKFIAINRFLSHKSDEMDVFQRFDVDIAVHFLALCVHKDFRGQGAASKLMKAALAFSKELGIDPVCVTGEGTSASSQRIYDKFGFETLHTVLYSDYRMNGEVVFTNTGDNLSTKIYVKKL